MGSASRWLLSLFDMSFLDHIATSNFIPTLQRLIFCRDTFSPFLAPLTVKNLPIIILNVLIYLVNLPVCGRSAIFIDPPPSHNSILNFKTIYVEARLSPLVHLFTDPLLRRWLLLEHCRGEFCSPKPPFQSLGSASTPQCFLLLPWTPASSCLASDAPY